MKISILCAFLAFLVLPCNVNAQVNSDDSYVPSYSGEDANYEEPAYYEEDNSEEPDASDSYVEETSDESSYEEDANDISEQGE